MKQIYNTLLILCAIFFMASCQEENDALGTGGTGYLRLTINGSSETTTKAANLPEGYTGEQLAVEIVDSEGKTVKSTDDWTEWEGDQIQLPAGTYTVKAHSYGFDGKQSAMAAPYYYGSDEVTIENGKEANATIVCSLANVKMSVKITDDIKANFKSFTIQVKAKDGTSCDPISFNLDLKASAIKDTAYFPVTDLVVTYAATGINGGSGSDEYELTSVKAKDHYILNFTLQDHGQGDVTVDVDETMHNYTFTFVVSQHPTNTASLSANAWSRFAYLKAESITTTSGVELTGVKFQYRAEGEGDEDWVDVTATEETVEDNPVYNSAKVSGLTANTTYEYRLVNADKSFTTSVSQFTTEEEVALYNGNFDGWYDASGVWYAVAEANYNDGNAFWDSGNKGASLMSKNPTSPEKSVVHTPGGKSAKLQSQYVGIGGALGAFAAGNLYTGHFVKTIGMSGAEIQFGSEFTGRPTQLHGYFQYTAGEVDYYGSTTPSDALVKDGGTDMNSIYIALSDADAPYTVNTKEGTFVDFDNDPNIIAYGELPVSECVTTSGWKEFTIDLVYRDLTRKPKYIIIVASASKYGDYFTGSTSSVMYIDDFELVYGDEPKVKE